MLSEYNQARHSYAEQKVREQDYDCSNEKGNNKGASNTTTCNNNDGGSVNTILTSQRNNRPQKTDLENGFITELKTCGLKAVKENVLVSYFQRIVCIHNDSVDALHSTLHESKELNNTYKCMVNRQENDIRTLKEEKADILSRIENLQVEYKKTQEDLFNCENRFEDAKKAFIKEKDLLLKKNKKDMDSFLHRMESEVDTVRSSIKEEAENRIAEARSLMQKEKDVEIHKLNEVISLIQIDNEKLVDCLHEEKTKSSSELNKLNASIEEGRAKFKDLQVQMKLTNKALQDKESQIQDLHQSMQENNDLWKKKVDTLGKEREKELSIVEEKVRQIVHSKDAKIKAATGRALNAETRQKELEDFLQNIESGFSEVERDDSTA